MVMLTILTVTYLSLTVSNIWAQGTSPPSPPHLLLQRPEIERPSGIRWILGWETVGETAPLMRWGKPETWVRSERFQPGFVSNRLVFGLGSQALDGWSAEADFGFRWEPQPGLGLESPRLRVRRENWAWSETWTYDGTAELRFPRLGEVGTAWPLGWGLRHEHQVRFTPHALTVDFLLQAAFEHRILDAAAILAYSIDFISEFTLGAQWRINPQVALLLSTRSGVQHAAGGGVTWPGVASVLTLSGSITPWLQLSGRTGLAWDEASLGPFLGIAVAIGFF